VPTYQIPLVLQLNGYYDELQLAHAYHFMIERHESLRIKFITVNGQAYQEIVDTENIPGLVIKDISQLDRDLKIYLQEQIMKPFDLSLGPLIRGELIRISNTEVVL